MRGAPRFALRGGGEGGSSMSEGSYSSAATLGGANTGDDRESRDVAAPHSSPSSNESGVSGGVKSFSEEVKEADISVAVSMANLEQLVSSLPIPLLSFPPSFFPPPLISCLVSSNTVTPRPDVTLWIRSRKGDL